MCVDDIKVWFPAENDDSVRYELGEVVSPHAEDDAEAIAEIILGPEVQAIRQAVIRSLCIA